MLIILNSSLYKYYTFLNLVYPVKNLCIRNSTTNYITNINLENIFKHIKTVQIFNFFTPNVEINGLHI